ncbi:72 kDa type IV collagenase-like [Ochlerotatus camptorhynchus]|uniref:72 kDa type IV collagenase-like n=1 Tax=Ochlerotatus camptorhynchus TaxID=644619 RepID=UPI0031D59CB6
MFAFKVFLLLVLVVSDSLVRSAPVEHRLEDVLIFDSDPDPPPGASARKVSDPTKRFNIPNVSEGDAEVLLGELGYNETVRENEFGVSSRFSFGSGLSFEDMIRNYQQDVGLDVTGKLDDETKLVIGSPHCGTRNLEKRGDTAKWTKRLISYRIRDYPAGASPEFVKSMIKRAFNEWSKVTNLDFIEWNDPGVDIEVNFGGTSHSRRGGRCSFDNPSTLAHAYFPEDGDVHFNEKYFFASSDYRDDFLDTAMHEIGHSLGLEHSNTKGVLMHPTDSNQHTEPQAEDVLRIQKLYGTRRGGRSLDTTSAPRLCTVTKFDAIVDDNSGRWYIFAGNYYYDTEESNPTAKLISSRWPGLTGPIDAAFRYPDEQIYFFKGELFWRYRGNRLGVGYPRRISEGFPGLPNRIDAAFVYSTNQIVAFKGSTIWFYDADKDTKPSFSLRSFGLPNNVDAVVGTGKSFVVFKDNNLYKFDNGRLESFVNKLMTC